MSLWTVLEKDGEVIEMETNFDWKRKRKNIGTLQLDVHPLENIFHIYHFSFSCFFRTLLKNSRQFFFLYLLPSRSP